MKPTSQNLIRSLVASAVFAILLLLLTGSNQVSAQSSNPEPAPPSAEAVTGKKATHILLVDHDREAAVGVRFRVTVKLEGKDARNRFRGLADQKLSVWVKTWRNETHVLLPDRATTDANGSATFYVSVPAQLPTRSDGKPSAGKIDVEVKFKGNSDYERCDGANANIVTTVRPSR